ncbi:type II toxin-antitoxin system VapB family antitoxin [Dyadobacter chenhuakuii]|uniref:DUF2281 domain-containing protein n=1 Tax=Dyadobacter chenhuakuii TaxID=2909339 RepID=A0A9X1QE13_9BACT|nr:DUF2281 domain-containing protein [Dyadobacter chenhuakuii]MCF2492040.1 DUF2281 domain-containing protein [Dyadobacter chenhuakuii]MCF2498603.1 DUF2281 domain-containing protein [Dyadobacter chenhuakuii]USJ28799.1 DUF2281 domain-containing protein [Dyadobacter chenhuakuii]
MMTDLKLYTKLSNLPVQQKAQVASFINNLKKDFAVTPQPNKKRQAGMAKGLIAMKDDFDNDIEGFNVFTK